MTCALEPFRVDVPESTLTDLKDRLARTRLPPTIPGIGWEYGTDVEYLAPLLAYWREQYDWRRVEAELNEFDQRLAHIDGGNLHVVHAPSPEADALPLVLVHGWPGSVVEFLDSARPLSDPRRHGADPRDAFHVVCVALPGFGFSGPTRARGWDHRKTAAAVADVMEALGYEHYGAQGGDWGAVVTSQLALQHPDRLVGLHLNMVPPWKPTPTASSDDLGGDDREAYRENRSRGRDFGGYAAIQSTRPHTIGVALDDSPAGLASWIVEKFRAWSDCDGDVDAHFGRDRLLDNMMLYWLTGTAHSAARMYLEATRAGAFGPADGRVEVPTAVADFPCEPVRPMRRWAEERYSIVRWTRMARGGHFAAMEEPELFTADVQEFFRSLRQA